MPVSHAAAVCGRLWNYEVSGKQVLLQWFSYRKKSCEPPLIGDRRPPSPLGHLPDWQKPELEIARAIVEDSGERFVKASAKFDFHEYRHMERFIGTVEDADDAEQLWRAIKGKGAFRCFKDTANRLGLLKEWYRYRDDVMQEFVVEWAEAHQVPVVDDVKPKAHP